MTAQPGPAAHQCGHMLKYILTLQLELMLMMLDDTQKRQSEFQVNSSLTNYKYNGKLNHCKYLKTKSKTESKTFLLNYLTQQINFRFFFFFVLFIGAIERDGNVYRHLPCWSTISGINYMDYKVMCACTYIKVLVLFIVFWFSNATVLSYRAKKKPKTKQKNKKKQLIYV